MDHLDVLRKLDFLFETSFSMHSRPAGVERPAMRHCQTSFEIVLSWPKQLAAYTARLHEFKSQVNRMANNMDLIEEHLL